MAQALRATGGTGILRDKIYWLDFSGMADLAAGGSVTRTFTVNGITVNVIVDQVAFTFGAPATARIQAYKSGTWTGDGLDDLYNRNGTGTNNTLTNALITNTAGIEGRFRVRAYATLNGSPFDLSLIYATAEEDNLLAEQSTGTTNGSGWQLVEGAVQSGSATRQIVFSGGTNQTISMKMSSNNSTTPANVALMHTSLAATSLASPLTVTFGIGPQFGTTGNGALALGIMLNQDMGDAPASYGAPNNFVAANITGGANNPPPLGGTYTLSGTLSNIAAANVTEPASPKLGTNPGDIENDYPASPVGVTDDNTATDDEDAFSTNPSININAFAYTANFTAFKNTTTASTPVYIMAWIDANRDGVFGPLEYATTSFTANNATQNISLPWNLATMPKNAGSSYMRVRISTINPSTLTDDTGTPADERSFAPLNNGETEDYPLTLFQPVPCTAGVVYGVQSTSGNADSQRVMYRVDTTNGTLSNPINLFGGGSAATSSTQRTTALALDVSTNTVWFCDRTNPRIYSYNLNTGTWGASVANFGNPAITGSQNINKAAYNIRDGNVYFHNVQDNNIYRFDPTNPNTAAVALGAISITGATGFTGGDLAFDSLGNMLGAFTSANVVAVFPASYNSNGDYLGFSLTGQIVRSIAANTPAGLAFLPSGNMLIGNSVGQTAGALSYLNTTTGVQTDIATGPPGGPFGFVDLASCSSPAPNLIVKKAASVTCNAGTTNVTYTITIQNTGRYHAFNVTFIDALPAGLTLASATLNGAALTTTNIGTTGVLIHSPSAIAGSGQVLKGETATIVLNCTAASTPANYSNQAFVKYAGIETLRLANNRIPSDDPSTGTANDATVVNNAGCGSVTGTLFNDNDGTTGGVNGTSTGMNAVTVELLSADGNAVLATTTTNASGAYTFSNRATGVTYIVRVTAPAGYSHVSSSDGITPTDGLTTVVLNTNQSGINLGLNQPPTASANNPASEANPGGTNNITIPATSFAGTDPNSGSIVSMTIPTFPTNATSITINSTTYTFGTFPGAGVTIPTGATGNPTQTITVDPAAGAVTVQIPFTMRDAAGLNSTGATLNVAFTAGAVVSGTVFNDNNGTTGNANGTNYTGGGLNVILISGTNIVLAVSPVSTVDGSYSLPDAGNGSYIVMLTTGNPAIGSTASASSTLPGTFANVSSSDNITPTDGRTSVTISAGNPATGISFGINQAPTATANNPASQPNPGGTNNVTIPATSFAGTAANGGSIGFVRITSFPTNATSITINGTTYTSATFPGGGVTVPTNASGNPTQTITVDPVAGAVTVQVPFVIISGAGVASAAQNLDLVFTSVASVTGIVFDDNNGTTGNANGTPYTAGGLNVIFIGSGIVVAVSAVSTVDGTYSLPDAPNGNYTVMLSSANPAIGAAAPASAVLPGTYQHVSSSDNITPTDGITSVTLGGSPLTGISFGISQPPTATSTNQTNQENPGGNSSVPIAATNFSANDPNGGSISTLTITGFPTNTTSITIGSTNHTAGNFPVAGVVIPTNAAGNPTQPISVDPVDGLVTVQIPYTLQDAAGLSTPPSTLDLVFSSTLPITLESFTAGTAGCKAAANWTVSNAINFSHFEVQLSNDGSNYRSVASIPYVPGTISYNYTLGDLTSGRHFLRLRLVDLDGTFEYSKTASVNINCDQQPIIAYPNPVYDKLTLRGLRAGDHVLIHSDLGQLLVNQRANDSKMEISLMPYSNGNYVVTIINKSGELVARKNIIKSTGR